MQECALWPQGSKSHFAGSYRLYLSPWTWAYVTMFTRQENLGTKSSGVIAWSVNLLWSVKWLPCWLSPLSGEQLDVQLLGSCLKSNESESHENVSFEYGPPVIWMLSRSGEPWTEIIMGCLFHVDADFFSPWVSRYLWNVSLPKIFPADIEVNLLLHKTRNHWK